MRTAAILTAITASIVLTGCGTLTGIPSHGGGKRFAVEQEMVATAARATAKDLDLSPLVGHKVALFVTVIGDEGSGTLQGGRYTLDALVRGEYLNTPTATTVNTFPVAPTTATTSSGGVTSTTTGESTLNAPATSTSNTKGSGNSNSVTAHLGGTGEYRNETLTQNPRDVTYLTNLLQTIFFLRGIDVVPPAQADTDVFVTVDVFGTIRSRTEWAISNQERLVASTKLEVFGVDRKTRKLLMPPRSSSFEAQYEEQYTFWIGPFNVTKSVKKSANLMVDFSDITDQKTGKAGGTTPVMQEVEASSQRSAIDPAVVRDRRN